MKIKLNKKGQFFDQMGAMAVAIAGLAIMLIITFLIISKGRASIINIDACGNTTHTYNSTAGLCCAGGASFNCAGTNQSGLSLAYNATNSLGNAVADIPNWVSLFVIAIVGIILLGIVMLFRGRS